MWRALLVIAVAACGQDTAPAPRSFAFGPYSLTPGQEITDQCVSVTLHNDAPIYVNSVELTTGPGFHHSNWFYVPEFVAPGADGTWQCGDRNFLDVVAGVQGGVLFAQSTQATHELQAFAPGVAIKIPAHSRIIGDTHLLNAGDAAITIPLSLAIAEIPKADVTTELAALSFENQALGLPPHKASKFTITACDIASEHQAQFGRAPDFSIYYALPHYHTLGTGLSFEAVRADGTSTVIYETTHRVGDALGGIIDPPFSMVGYTKIRFSCSYDNPRDTTVHWGFGDQEMCVFLAFTNSTRTWGGGALMYENPGPGVDTGTEVDFTHGCQVISNDASH
ncbi:MAG: hypothetical protein JWO36_3090 [Myxococcales bacterium]|nr:hypothetical protein [Myxococcales bacterium]